MAGKYTRILFEAFKLLIGKSQTEMTFKITKNVRWYLLHTKTKQKHLTFGVLIKKKKKFLKVTSFASEWLTFHEAAKEN